MAQAKITSKGQITIPKSIRLHLHLHSGDLVEFVINDKGHVILIAKSIDAKKLYGIVKTDKKVSIDEMNQAIKRAASKRYKES